MKKKRKQIMRRKSKAGNSTLKSLRQQFPNLTEETAEQIDLRTKAYISQYGDLEMNRKTARYLEDCLRTSKTRLPNEECVKKRCNKLAANYLANDDAWMSGENIFCVLAFFLSVISMICKILETLYPVRLGWLQSDYFNLALYGGALILWQLIMSHVGMDRKKRLFLSLFNRYSPTMIILMMAIFYLLFAVRCPVAAVIPVSACLAGCVLAAPVYKYKKIRQYHLMDLMK